MRRWKMEIVRKIKLTKNSFFQANDTSEYGCRNWLPCFCLVHLVYLYKILWNWWLADSKLIHILEYIDNASLVLCFSDLMSWEYIFINILSFDFQRHREVLVNPSTYGRSCPKKLMRRKKCRQMPCPADTAYWYQGSWRHMVDPDDE